MDIDVFQRRDLETVFRTLRTALRRSGPLDSREQAFLRTYARITGHALRAGDLEPIRPKDVSIEGGHERKRLLQLSGLAALLSQPVRPDSAIFLRDLSQHLEAWDPVVSVVDALGRGRRVKARLLTARRGFRVMIKEQYLSGGVTGVLRFFGALLFGITVDKGKHGAYKRLGLLPEGTLGREYWKHMTQIGFGFPGEPGGIPDAAVFHDIGHVLAGNDTTPLGEIQQGSFQGGNRREDGFSFVQFAILHFHHGIQITPAAAPTLGNFDPEKVLWAIHRGAQCRVDMTHQWNFWPLMALALEEARASCGLLPKQQAAA